MIHKNIQEKLLLFLDGNLPDKEMQQFRDHLSTCSDCAERYKMFASVWQSESRLEKVAPSPFLWTKLQARIKEYEQTPVIVWDLKKIFQGITLRPIPSLAVIAAVVFGIYLGTPREPQRYEHTQSVSQLAGASDELGLDQFDVIPPGALGSTLVNNSNRQK